MQTEKAATRNSMYESMFMYELSLEGVPCSGVVVQTWHPDIVDLSIFWKELGLYHKTFHYVVIPESIMFFMLHY